MISFEHIAEICQPSEYHPLLCVCSVNTVRDHTHLPWNEQGADSCTGSTVLGASLKF